MRGKHLESTEYSTLLCRERMRCAWLNVSGTYALALGATTRFPHSPSQTPSLQRELLTKYHRMCELYILPHVDKTIRMFLL